MKAKNFALLLIALFACFTATTAAQTTPEQRKAYADKLRQYKRQILTRELDLTRDQANQFFPLYDKMDDELQRIGRETRMLEQRTINNSQATATECESAAYTLFEQKKAEAEVELRYFPQFKAILTPRQLLRLKAAERTFRQEVLKYFSSDD